MLSVFKNYSEATEAFDSPTLDVQNNLLNYIACKDGYASWRELIRDKLYINRDYKYFDEILKIDTKRFNLDISGFKTIEDQISYLSSSKNPCLIIDSTDLRIMPETEMRNICRLLDITYSEKMIQWGDERINFYTEQKRPHDLIWYSELYSSTKVNLPTEVPPALSDFPVFIQKFLKSVDLPVYARLSQNKFNKENSRNFNEIELNLNLIKHRTRESKKFGIAQNGLNENKNSIKLKMIDPIYAITNCPELFKDEEFKETNKEYFDEMNLIYNAVKDIGEKKENKIYEFEKIR